jgi:hypothetical protein
MNCFFPLLLERCELYIFYAREIMGLLCTRLLYGFAKQYKKQKRRGENEETTHITKEGVLEKWNGCLSCREIKQGQ